jgi:myo-inositol-1(or 4)-monophosphatase
MKNRRPVIGLMHQPFIRETFFAGSRGAWLKSGKRVKRMRTSATSEIGDAVLYSTHPSLFSGKGELKAFKNVEGRCRYSRYGSDCYGYCLLASGFADIVIEAGLHAYDIIPLIPVIRSAGGIVTDWNGRQPLNGGRVIAAANRSLHKKAIALLNQ